MYDCDRLRSKRSARKSWKILLAKRRPCRRFVCRIPNHDAGDQLILLVNVQETEKSRPGTARFVGQSDSIDESLKKQTVGLVRLEDFQNKRRQLEEAQARSAARTDELK